MQYDNQNIFAKILRGEIPSHKVYEDDKALALWISCRWQKGMF